MHRFLKWLLYIAAAAAVLLVVAVSAFLWWIPGPSAAEVSRVASPRGDIEGVLIETNGGATTSFGYEIFVVPRGTKPSGTPAAFLYGASRSQSAYGVNLRWPSDSNLDVEYESAKSAKVGVPLVVVANRNVHVELKSNVSDPNAPPGGMLYNLKGRP
jgi:hypothetical protein